MYVINELKSKLLKSYSNNEISIVKVQIQISKHAPLNIIGTYVPPGSDFSNYADVFSSFVANCSIIIGDMNTDILKYNDATACYR